MSSIVLPPELDAKVEERIASGAAATPVEVIRAGLEALEAADAAKLEAIRAMIARAISDPRLSKNAAEVFDRAEAIVSAAAKK